MSVTSTVQALKDEMVNVVLLKMVRKTEYYRWTFPGSNNTCFVKMNHKFPTC